MIGDVLAVAALVTLFVVFLGVFWYANFGRWPWQGTGEQ